MSIQTANLEAAAEAVPEHPTVYDARLVDRRDQDGRRVLEVVLGPQVDRVPPGVLRALAEADCGLDTVQSQGTFLVAIAE
ncbi:hypothetical protein NP511_02210 [Natrinema thermotolerans]|uniref:Uncharacterized protein n=1 Tax=Natrinema thermotolerans TaxID=121872 RepID=A0AAF0PC68_9EURY|nr:hypothetical protein [Natrinema thermotolerans]WPH65873.1 hypothetical protein HJTV4_gp51 [Haloarchaeal virus HJTV-4]QCC60777.1 hypothetical protein DVR14_19900 [Natrinema thermotolerans]QCC61656.1 hypothetical protein DVR14_24040 [Natrinema thermotolerans]WMT07823.1 hypothetical protein NP511_20925 [Natrinema thermotolerans]WMT08455.1 hypothetical protein NP511_02210 [Natrinema thermotolerans]